MRKYWPWNNLGIKNQMSATEVADGDRHTDSQSDRQTDRQTTTADLPLHDPSWRAFEGS